MIRIILFTLAISANCYSYDYRVCSNIELNRMSAPGPGPGFEWLNDSISSVNISFDESFKIQVLDNNGSLFRNFKNCYHIEGINYINIECYPEGITPEDAEGVYDLRAEEYIKPPIYPFTQIQIQFDTELTTLMGFYEFGVFSWTKCHKP